MKNREYKVILFDDFNGSFLNKDYWFEFYLPQWSSSEASKPFYTIKDSVLRLFIKDNQEPWCSEWNGNVRVSNFQTGVFSGSLGTCIGQHHFTNNIVVQEEQKKEIKVAL